MSGWKEYKLGEIVTFQRGHDLPKSEMMEGPFPVAGSNGVIGFHNNYTTKGPGITIGRSGNIGNPKLYLSNFWAHNTTLYVKEFKKVDPIFFFYLLKTLDFSQLNSGSAVPSLNRNYIHPFLVKIPEDIETQNAIAEILSSLDDKIELNNAINKNLEDLAQALFKRWFVDFEFPNEEGLPYQSSGGEMVESELGMIPKGWRDGKLGDFISFTKGKKPKSTTTIKEIGYLPQILIETFDTGKSVFASPEKMVIANESEIIMVMDGASSGRMEVGFSGIIGSTLAKINSKGICNSFIFYFLKLKEDDIKMNTTGAAIPHADKSLIIDYDISLPSKELLNQFDRINSEIWCLISIYKAEKNKLKFLRDMLLPKLISGELEVFEQSKKNDHAEI